MKKFRLIDFISLAFISIVFLVIYLLQEEGEKEFFDIVSKNKAFATGKITSYSVGRWSHSFRYFFVNNNDSTVNSFKVIGHKIKKENRNKFVNQLFPVVYAKNNPEYHQMLVFERDFKEWGLSYPDSLKWISTSYY